MDLAGVILCSWEKKVTLGLGRRCASQPTVTAVKKRPCEQHVVAPFKPLWYRVRSGWLSAIVVDSSPRNRDLLRPTEPPAELDMCYRYHPTTTEDARLGSCPRRAVRPAGFGSHNVRLASWLYVRHVDEHLPLYVALARTRPPLIARTTYIPLLW